MVMKSEQPLPVLTGQITRETYSARALAHCKALSPREHPVIRSATPAFENWRRYFDGHLGWRPMTFQRLIDWPNAGHEFTVPEENPEWFDKNYIASARPVPALVKPRPQIPMGLSRATVLVRRDNPKYREMVEHSRTGDRLDFQFTDEGILVSELWLPGVPFR